MFSEENSKREQRFYADLLTQQGRALAEINAANATNTEFLRGLQDATLGVIATTIQQRQGINVQGDTSHTTQTPERQERTPETVTPAEELEETPANEEPIEEIGRTEEPEQEELVPVEQLPREQHRRNWGNPQPRARNGGRRGRRPTGPPPMPPRQPPPRHPAHREPPPPSPPESPPGSGKDPSAAEEDNADDERGGVPGHERPGRRRRNTRARSPHVDRRMPTDASPGYDFRNLDRAEWGERATR